jgi:hypothetical protein
MNERIQKLWEQAAKTTQGDSWEEQTMFIEKFAQLIVRECIEQLVMEGDAWEQFSRNPPEGQENNASAALFAAYRLKEDAVSRLEEHFGVEE